MEKEIKVKKNTMLIMFSCVVLTAILSIINIIIILNK